MSNIKPTVYNGLIIYDACCGLCRSSIAKNKSFFEKHNFRLAALQDPEISELTGLKQDTLELSIHLMLPNGEILNGINVFEYISSKIYYLLPVYLLLKFPLIKRGLSGIYKYISQRRIKISKICGL